VKRADKLIEIRAHEVAFVRGQQRSIQVEQERLHPALSGVGSSLKSIPVISDLLTMIAKRAFQAAYSRRDADC